MELLTVREIIAKAEKSDIHLSTDGNGVQARGPQDAMTSELKQMIMDFKPEIIQALSEPNPTVENKLPVWCSRSCSDFMVLASLKGKLAGCCQKFNGHIAWVRLSFMNGCPEKLGRAAVNDDGWPDWK